MKSPSKSSKASKQSKPTKADRRRADWPTGIRISHRRGDKWTILYATSRTPGEPPYMLDMEAYRYNGECPCWDFRKNYQSHAREQQHWKTGRIPQRCDHLIAGREWLMNKFFKTIATKMDMTHPHNTHN